MHFFHTGNKGTKHIFPGHWTYDLREINTNGLERSGHNIIARIQEIDMLLHGKQASESFLK